MKLLKTFVANLTGAVQSNVLFPEKPVIHFSPEISKCPVCDTTLHVQKTEIKSVVTMDIGEFYAKQTIMNCPYGHGIFKSKQLQNLVPRGGTFGFDVIIEIGYSLFIHCRSNQDTMAALAAKNIFISEREISYLGRKFIIYLALVHRQSQPVLRKFLMRRGGYILHVDGTCEGDSPNLFCGLDGISELVLDTVKIASEKKEKLVPFFMGIRKQYGEPKALVHDMGKGILNAVAEVFPYTPDFICHFHFLRDIGKDLLNNDYTTLLKRLRKIKVRPKLRRRAKYLEQKINPDCHDAGKIIESLQSGKWQTNNFDNVPLITAYALIQWIFDYQKESDGYGFPFDHPYLDFYRRIQKVHILLSQIKEINFNDSAKANRPFIQLYKAITITAEDNLLYELAQKLESKIEAFNKLRCAMRIALPEGKNGINDNGDVSDMKSIEEKVTAFRKWILNNKHRGKTYSTMVAQIDKYWEKLFADPIQFVGPDGVVRNIQPQRTNNILERFFRDVKRQNRKKTGMASLNKVLQAVLAETPLVQNLKNDDYRKIILNGCTSLTERFSQIDADQVQQEMAKVTENNDRILPGIKKIISDEELTIKFSALFSLTEAK